MARSHAWVPRSALLHWEGRFASVPLITSSQFGIGFAYPLGPGKSSVITSVVSGGPVKSGFWGAIQGDD